MYFTQILHINTAFEALKLNLKRSKTTFQQFEYLNYITIDRFDVFISVFR